MYFLFQHVISKAVISNSKSSALETKQVTSSPLVSESIGQTIAHLLSLIPHESFYPCILSDLIDLLMDLAVISEAKLLDGHDSCRVVILLQTMARSDLELPEYFLDIASMEQILSLQAVTFTIINTFLADLHRKRLVPQPDNHFHDPRFENPLSPSGTVDLMFYPVNESLLPQLLAALRHSVLSKPSTILALLSHMAAGELLLQLLKDWHSDAALPSLLAEASILIARAAYIFLETKVNDGEKYRDFAALLASMMHLTIVKVTA